ncbi:MAG: trimethylamine methyltransferase family protein [Anaerolineales bacterium]|nr:trimethylamine methyltransferase family protein [Anaerolineales bacterium]
MEATSDAQVIPNLNILTREQIGKIHQATLQVLENTGVRVAHEEGLQLMRDAGCRIKNQDIVLIPDCLVEQCLDSAPSFLAIYDQKGDEAMQLGGRNNYYGLGTDLIRTQDLYTGKTRPSVLQDVVNAALVADYCEHINFIASFSLPSDTPTNTMYITCVKAQLENSTKPIFFTAAGKEDLAFIIEMAEVVAAEAAGYEDALRDKPFIINYSEPTPPLTHSFGAVSKLFLCAEKGVPVCYTPAAMLGASAPVTIAGALVQTNAEALSGLILHQLKAKGAPIISGVAIPPMDMKTFSVSYSAPDLRVGNAACADLYHYYGLPVWSTTGSDAHTFDAQATMEHALCILMASLEGSNLIHDVGYLGQGLLSNPAMIVMCNELISYVKRIIRGFRIDTEKLGLETIDKVGPGGNYLVENHTLQHFRDELWVPTLMNRENLDGWMSQGSERFEERVIKRTKSILNSHRPEALTTMTQRRIDDILARSSEELAGFHFIA